MTKPDKFCPGTTYEIRFMDKRQPEYTWYSGPAVYLRESEEGEFDEPHSVFKVPDGDESHFPHSAVMELVLAARVDDFFEILPTQHEGMAPSITFAFEKAREASKTWRFKKTRTAPLADIQSPRRKHKLVDSAHAVHIFVNEQNLPLAINFRQIEKLTSPTDPVDASMLRKMMYAFSVWMIAYGEMVRVCLPPEEQDNDRIYPRIYPTPDLPIVDSMFDCAGKTLSSLSFYGDTVRS